MANNQEIGRLGQKRFAGTFFEEFVPDLVGLRGVNVYKEMANNDDTIGAILFAVEMLIRQCTFNVEPQGDTEADKKAAKFVEECMNDMQYSWTDTISEIVSFITYGWSYHEIVYKYRHGKKKDTSYSSKYNDGLIGWKKLPIRSQDTLFEWKYADGSDDLLGMVQSPPPDFGQIFIPIEKALHFTTKSVKANPEGKSALRSCYRSWFFKKRIQEIEGIGIERDLAGFPLLKAPEGLDLWDAEDQEMVRALANAESIVSSIRRDSREGLVLPFGWDLSLVSTGSRRQFDTNQIIERYDKRMATTVMADFIFMGQQAVGSFALADNKTALFALAVGTYIDIICEVFSNQAIPRLIDLNGKHFAGITDYPKMTHGDIEKEDVEKIATFIEKMVGVGLLQPDEELEDYVRDIAGLPERPEGAHNSCMTPQQQEAAQKQEGALNGMGKEQQTKNATMYQVTSILEKFRRGNITRAVAAEMLQMIGIPEDKIERYLKETEAIVRREPAEKPESAKVGEKSDSEEAAAAKKELGRVGRKENEE